MSTASRALGPSQPVTPHEFTRLDGDAESSQDAPVAAEVGVALACNGRPHAVMMCPPADLEDFAVGFTITE